MPYPIRDVDGIDDQAVKALKRAGIRTSAALLHAAGNTKGRKELAARSGLDEQLLLHLANAADRMRIHGLGKDYSVLVRAAGVKTVRDLRHRNAQRLFDAIRKANEQRRLVAFLPSQKAVERWIEEAKSLDIKISY